MHSVINARIFWNLSVAMKPYLKTTKTIDFFIDCLPNNLPTLQVETESNRNVIDLTSFDAKEKSELVLEFSCCNCRHRCLLFWT